MKEFKESTLKNENVDKLNSNEMRSICGGARRVDIDHVGAYNFMVEISGIPEGPPPSSGGGSSAGGSGGGGSW